MRELKSLPVLSLGCWGLWSEVAGARQGMCIGVEKAQSAGWCCGLRHPSLRGPPGLLKEVLLIERAGFKSLGGVWLYSVQITLPGAGGQVGEVPEAVSWEWLPGAPCGSICCCEGRPA